MNTPLTPEKLGLSKESYLKVRRFIIESGDEAYATAKSERDNVKAIENDITTACDIRIEKSFATLVKDFFPDHGFIGEEEDSLHHDREYSWYLDPIDGTHYFSKGVPLWSISLALMHNEKPIVSLIYNPSTRDIYEAQVGAGAFYNEQRLPNLNPAKSTSRGRMVWDFVNWTGIPDEKKLQAEKLFQSLREMFNHHICMVSGSLSLAFMSQGAFTAFVDPYRRKKKFVDIAAGLLLASEVGCLVHRKSLSDSTEEIVVATPEIMEEVLAAIEHHMK